MADLPPVAHCDTATPPAGYRARYECVSYLSRAEDSGNGRFWHAEFKVPEGPDVADFDFYVILPSQIEQRFRARNIKQIMSRGNDGRPETTFSFTLYGTASYGNCKPGKEDCVIPAAMKATLLYK